MVSQKAKREKTIREAKNNLILDAARRIFAENGFHGARLEDIAAAAGFSKASLYNYYEDKEAIFLNLAVREYERLLERLEQLVDEHSSFEQSIRSLLKAIFSVFGEHFAFLLTTSNFRVMNVLNMGRLCEHHQKHVKHFQKSFQSIQQHFVTLISSARRRGEVSSELSDEILAGFLGSVIRGVLFNWKLAGKMGDFDSEIDRVMMFLRKGMDLA